MAFKRSQDTANTTTAFRKVFLPSSLYLRFCRGGTALDMAQRKREQRCETCRCLRASTKWSLHSFLIWTDEGIDCVE